VQVVNDGSHHGTDSNVCRYRCHRITPSSHLVRLSELESFRILLDLLRFMSFTTTIERTESWKLGTILLTPSKRRRASSEAESPTPHEPVQPPTAELWKWTLTHEAIAPCFVQDVFKMREHNDTGKGKFFNHPCPKHNLTITQEADFFWLGRVPCRTVRIVALVVGVKTYEKRVVYTGICLLLYIFAAWFMRICHQWTMVHLSLTAIIANLP
jgi:hypothetical protein